MSISPNEVKRWALDVSDWMWGTAQGAFNEKQTTSQIIVDAVIGMIPLIGDATAVRDLIAVSTRLSQDEQKRDDATEWLLLVVLLFALIPIMGGVIKGVGLLILKAGKTAAENNALIQDVVRFLNRIGRGNALKWFKQLNLLKYQRELIQHFNALMDRLIEALTKIREKLGWFLSKDMKQSITYWIESFKRLKPYGAKMIPQALNELNARLKSVQQAVYKAEWHTVTPGTLNKTYEQEARLVEGGPKRKPERIGWKKNQVTDYQHADGWPDLRKQTIKTADGAKINKTIEAFSGPMTAVTLKGPKTIYRVLRPKGLENGDNALASPWWTETLPPNAKAFREGLAVTNAYNKNSYYIKLQLQAGEQLKVWRGKAAEQFDAEVGQYLPGGDYQLFIDLRPQVVAQINRLPLEFTHWPDAEVLYGVDTAADIAHHVHTEKLGKYEIESKRNPKPLATSPVVAGTRAYAAHERSQDSETK